MKENQAILEVNKNENLEAVKRLCSMLMTLAKMGFALLKKLPWAKMGKVIMLLVTLIAIVVAAFIKFFAENAAKTISEGDRLNTDETTHDNWDFRGDSGMWMNNKGEFTVINNGDDNLVWIEDK